MNESTRMRIEDLTRRGALRPGEAAELEALSDEEAETRLADLTRVLLHRAPAGSAPTIIPGELSDTQTHLGALARKDLGPYLLIRELGRGGMGVVYLAEERDLHRRVALKILAQGIASDTEALERFRREASACARLEHPNVVAVHGMGEADGCHYYAMEYVEGRPLSEVIDRERVPAERAVFLAMQAARGLGHAHDRGVVHRDVKPHNLLVMRRLSRDAQEPRSRRARAASTPVAEGEELVKVADFGLARMEGSRSLTVSGDIMGTPAYMSPEQARGARLEIGPATDVYSLGATLYEMLVGHPPFQSDEVAALLRQIDLVEPTPPRRFVPALDHDLETITMKCLEKDPRRRYANGNELADDMARWLAEEPVCARPVGAWEHAWRRARRNPLASVLAAILVLAVLGGAVTLAVGAILRSREITRQVASIGRALDGGDLGAAAADLDALAALDRKHPELGPLRARLEFTKALRLGLDAKGRFESGQAQVGRLMNEVSRLRDQTQEWDPVSKKLLLWESEAEEQKARRQAGEELDSALTFLLMAYRLGGSNAEAADALAGLYWGLYDDAVARNSEGEIRACENKVREFGGPKAEEQLLGLGEVRMSCEPPAVRVSLFRYENTPEGVLFPMPYDPRAQRIVEVPRPPIDPVPAEEVEWLEPHIDFPRAEQAASDAARLLEAGRREDAERKLREAVAFDAKHLASRWNLARLLASGAATPQRIDEALQHLECAVALGEELSMIEAEPLFTSLKGNPRFDTLPDVFAGRIPPRHVLVIDVPQNSLAADLGVRPGDVLLSWNGARIETAADAKAAVAGLGAAAEVEARVLRGGEERTLRAKAREPFGFTLTARDFHAAFPTRRVIEVRDGTAFPLSRREENRIATGPGGEVALALRPGSYLLLFEKEGCLEARCPISLDRPGRPGGRSTWEGKVRLLGASDFPTGIVHVPAGAFRMGGDAEARQRLKQETSGEWVELDDFLMARYPVCNREWLEFLNDPAVGDQVGTDGSLRLVPRQTENTNAWFHRDAKGIFHPAEPPPRADRSVLSVSWEDANEYVKWLSTRLRARGCLPEGWEVRLPDEEEWEKAARGVDGRCFPWGNRADPVFARVDHSRSLDFVQPEEQGLFPADESPFGIRDLCGGEMEFTRTGLQNTFAIMKGGCWSSPIRYARCANNQLALLRSVTSASGVRWVIGRARR